MDSKDAKPAAGASVTGGLVGSSGIPPTQSAVTGPPASVPLPGSAPVYASRAQLLFDGTFVNRGPGGMPFPGSSTAAGTGGSTGPGPGSVWAFDDDRSDAATIGTSIADWADPERDIDTNVDKELSDYENASIPLSEPVKRWALRVNNSASITDPAANSDQIDADDNEVVLVAAVQQMHMQHRTQSGLHSRQQFQQTPTSQKQKKKDLELVSDDIQREFQDIVSNAVNPSDPDTASESLAKSGIQIRRLSTHPDQVAIIAEFIGSLGDADAEAMTNFVTSYRGNDVVGGCLDEIFISECFAAAMHAHLAKIQDLRAAEEMDQEMPVKPSDWVALSTEALNLEEDTMKPEPIVGDKTTNASHLTIPSLARLVATEFAPTSIDDVVTVETLGAVIDIASKERRWNTVRGALTLAKTTFPPKSDRVVIAVHDLAQQHLRRPFALADKDVYGSLAANVVANHGKALNVAFYRDLIEDGDVLFEAEASSSAFMSKEELQEYNHELNNQRILAAETAKARKAKMEEYDHKRSANAKLSALEQETKDKSNYLLAKAQMQLEEQEDEIKHMNELMLYAKCVAIRDAQVEEKKMIARERKEEDARLDAMMEIERVNELKKLEEREKRRIEGPVELRKGAAKIREQIEERREAALLEQERRDQETKQILKAIADMNEQDKAEKLQKIKMQRIMMLDVAKANQESTERRRQMKIAEEEEDKKVLQYILDKEQREIEKDRIMQQKKAEREIELAQQDALRAQRAYEAYEREWRRKEKETAEKHKLQEDELKAERIKQQRAREHAIAVEARKMKDEFFENLRRQKETEERIKAEEALKHNKNRLYSTEVQAQIRQKEALKKKQREEFFMEGVRLSQERLDKTNKIDQIKDRKIQELRNIGVPQKYCKELERQLPPDNGGVDNCMERDPNSSHSEYGAIGDLLPAPMQMHDMHMQMYNIPQFLPQQAVFDSHGLSPIHQHIAQQRQHQHQLPFNGHTRDYDHNYANHQEHDGLPMYSDNPFFFNHHHNHSYHSQEMNQIQIQNPYMDTMHLHFNHSLVNPHQRSHFGLPQPEFGAFAPVAMNLIEGSAVRTADGDEPEGNFVFTTTDTQAPDSPRHTHHAVPQGNGPASAGGSFPTHSAMSPRSTLAMRGLTQIDANGTMMRLEKRPDSPNAWAWVPAETDRYPPTVAADSGAASGRGHAAPAADHPNCSAFYECHRALARDVSAEDGPRFDSSSALRHETESFGNSTFCGNDGRSFKKNAAHQFCDMLQLQLVSDNDLEAMAASTAALATGAAYVTSKVGGMAMNDESDDNGQEHQQESVQGDDFQNLREKNLRRGKGACYDEGTGGSIICEHRRQKYACPKVVNFLLIIA
ncbi:Cilia- and flagella-associated protein 45 [Entophlyctis luteolus]|nr:Cilia- and flagella-associated protein 45 [Entophlyctis luteolus]